MTTWMLEHKSLFSEIGIDLRINFSHDTHYDALNFVFSKVRGNVIHRIDFQPMQEGSYRITKLQETYPAFPRFFEFCQNQIPYFPRVAKIAHADKGEIDSGNHQINFKEQVKKIVENAL